MEIPRTLLVVDGHQGVREALVDRLRRSPGIRGVAAAGDVQAALSLMREMAPDVVICDHKTVEGDPGTVLPLLARDGQPVVVLTSSLYRGEPTALTRAGAAAMLLKGCSTCTLLATIETAIEERITPASAFSVATVTTPRAASHRTRRRR